MEYLILLGQLVVSSTYSILQMPPSVFYVNYMFPDTAAPGIGKGLAAWGVLVDTGPGIGRYWARNQKKLDLVSGRC